MSRFLGLTVSSSEILSGKTFAKSQNVHPEVRKVITTFEDGEIVALTKTLCTSPEYFADIGLTYVSIPVITTGLAMAFHWRPE